MLGSSPSTRSIAENKGQRPLIQLSWWGEDPFWKLVVIRHEQSEVYVYIQGREGLVFPFICLSLSLEGFLLEDI